MSRFRNLIATLFGRGKTDSSRSAPGRRPRRRKHVDAPLIPDVPQIPRSVPEWALRSLPLNATSNSELETKIEQLAPGLPQKIGDVLRLLQTSESYTDYDNAANCAIRQVWQSLDLFLCGTLGDRTALLYFAEQVMPPAGQAYVVRRLIRDRDSDVRRKAMRLLARGSFTDVGLPVRDGSDWDTTGWACGVEPGRLYRHQSGPGTQQQRGVPQIATNAELRELLGIKSQAQLGYLLLATDADDGPYARFSIPKRDGSDRQICAPKTALRLTQRNILDRILGEVPVHVAAHGFVPGRSTVTNAAPHQKAELIIKFDLSDFFPTISFFRAAGLFASLGYVIERADGGNLTSADDDDHRVGATLARLCTYSQSVLDWSSGFTPQGAPTSPVISNLICRRLDARLTGLAASSQGTYTRYADDLTFSFTDDSSVRVGRFRWWVDQICQQEGFFVNQRKFRVLRRSQRQSVTGIVVNDCLRVPRDQRRRFRAILHNCQRHGVESQTRGRDDFRNWLRGFASYIHMVHPEEGRALLSDVDELLRTESS